MLFRSSSLNGVVSNMSVSSLAAILGSQPLSGIQTALVTKDEIADINNLKMNLDVNGKRMQTGNTSTMKLKILVI